MAGDLGDLVARLKVDTTSLDGAVAKMHGLGSALNVGFAAAAAAIVGVGVVSVDMAAKFQSATDLMASQAGITQAQAKLIGDAFLGTAGQVTFSGQAIMSAFSPVSGQLKLVEGHALNAADSLAFMNDAMNIAEATGQPLAAVTSALANVMQAYGLSVAQAGPASDILFNASTALNIPVSSLADTVDKLHAKLGPLSPSLADTSSLLLDVASHGLTGQRALLLVSTAFNTLLGNSKPTNAEIKTLGLNLYTSTGQFVGMKSVIDQLAPKLAGMTEAQRLLAEKELFGSGASKALDATIMAGQPGYATATTAATKLGTAHAGASTATDNLKGSFDKIKSDLQDMATKFGLILTPVLQLVANDALPAINGALKIMGTPPISTILLTTLGAIVTSFTAFKAIAVGGEIVKMLQFMTSTGTVTGMSSLGVASTAAFAPWLRAVPAVTAIAGAIETLQGAKPGQQSIGNPFGLTVPGMPGNPGNAFGGGIFGTPHGTGVFHPPKTYPRAAVGGPVMPNMSYLVGELGPELFRPNVGGMITSHADLLAARGAGGIVQNVTINVAPGADRTMVPLIKSVIHQENATLIRSIHAGRR